MSDQPLPAIFQLSPEQARKRRRHAMELIGVCVIGLVPWTVYLALTLPTAYRAHHWQLVWVGFDVMLLSSMAVTAYLGWRRRQAVIGGAVTTATLLVCDAWFDIALDLGTPDIWASMASAAFIELPLAFFFARRAQLLARYTLIHLYPALGQDGPPPPLRKLPLFIDPEEMEHLREPEG